MLTKTEAEKLAVVANTLRAEWSEASVMAVLGDERIRLRRGYRDAALALVAIATDPDTRRPTRLLESGPWWLTIAAAAGLSASAHIDYAGPDNCATCGKAELSHHNLAVYADHPYVRPIDHARQVAERKTNQEDTA